MPLGLGSQELTEEYVLQFIEKDSIEDRKSRMLNSTNHVPEGKKKELKELDLSIPHNLIVAASLMVSYGF